MTCWQAMDELKQLGYRFDLTAEGRVRASIRGTKPPEASALLDIVRRDRESAAAYVQVYSVFDALAISQAIKAGEARLICKVIYHRRQTT